MKIRGLLGIALTLLLALLAAACGGGGNQGGGSASGGLTPVTFRLDWIVDGSHTCYFAALQQGFFRDEGLDVQILEGAGSGTTANLIANGTNDFGFSDAGVVAKAINDGAPIKMVMDIYQRNPSVIISLADTGITSPETLAGKNVGAAPGEAPLQLLPAYLSASGVDPGQVNVVNMDPGAKISALLGGRVDAIVGYSSSDLPIAEVQSKKDLNVQHYADYGVVTLSNGIITSNDMISKHPDLVRSFVRAVQKGFEYCQANPDKAVGMLADQFPQSVNADEATVALHEVLSNLHTDRTKNQPIGYMDPADWKDTLATLVKYADLSQPKSADVYFTDDFVK
jgi:NitT/TauT family transport system substrate-binding protein